MRVNIDVHRDYTHDEIREIMGWGDNLELQDVTQAIMVLCDVVERQGVFITVLQAELGAVHKWIEGKHRAAEKTILDLEAENEKLRSDITTLMTGDAPGDMVERGTGSLTSI